MPPCCGDGENGCVRDSTPLLIDGAPLGPSYAFKCVLLGDHGAGKSCLAIRFVKDDFDPTQESTIGAAFYKKTVSLTPEQGCDLQIWDTAGEERYRAMSPMYIRGAAAIIIVYDISVQQDFKRLKEWFTLALKSGGEGIPFFLLANKSDLLKPEDPDPEKNVELVSLLSSLPVSPSFRLVSAKEGTGIKGLLEDIAQKSNTYINGFEPPCPANIKRAGGRK